MSFFDSISDAGEWREHPLRNGGRAILCGISPFLCVAEHGLQQTSELTDSAVASIENIASNTDQAAGGVVNAIRESLPSVDDVRAVGNTIDTILMWLAIIGGILLAIIVIGVILFYVH